MYWSGEGAGGGTVVGCPIIDMSPMRTNGWLQVLGVSSHFNELPRFILQSLTPYTINHLVYIPGAGGGTRGGYLIIGCHPWEKVRFQVRCLSPLIWDAYCQHKMKEGRKSFLHEVQPLSQPPQTARLTLWEEQRSAKQHLAKLPIPTSEQLAPGHKSEWKLWKSLNRLRTGMGRSKTNMSKWGYADTADTACECGTSEQTMQHLLRCPLLENECSLEDLATANEKALHCARAWPNIWLNSEMMDTKEETPNTRNHLVYIPGAGGGTRGVCPIIGCHPWEGEGFQVLCVCQHWNKWLWTP